MTSITPRLSVEQAAYMIRSAIRVGAERGIPDGIEEILSALLQALQPAERPDVAASESQGEGATGKPALSPLPDAAATTTAQQCRCGAGFRPEKMEGHAFDCPAAPAPAGDGALRTIAEMSMLAVSDPHQSAEYYRAELTKVCNLALSAPAAVAPLSEGVTLSLRYPNQVVHRPRVDCQHEGMHLIADCGAFKAPAPVPSVPPAGGEARTACVPVHVWTHNYGDDWHPERGTPCDCGQRRYGWEKWEYDVVSAPKREDP